MFWVSEFAIQGAEMWPLPGLVLVVWASLGAALFAFVTISKVHDSRLPGVAWAITGALIPYIVLGAFSIGPMVLVAFLFSLVASIIMTVQEQRELLDDLLMLVFGSLGNLVLFMFFLAFQRLAERGM